MNPHPETAAAFAAALLATSAFAASPDGFVVFGGTEEDDDGVVTEIWRPMSQEQFSAHIESKYKGDYAGHVAEIEAEQAAWDAAREDWNRNNPGDEILADEDDPDFDYGDDDGDTFGEPTEELIRRLLERKGADGEEDPEDYGGIGEKDVRAGTLDELPDELQPAAGDTPENDRRQAFEEDVESGTTSDGFVDRTLLDASLDEAKEVFKDFSFDLMSGGVNPASHSIAGLFSWFQPESMPLLSETDEARRKLVGGDFTVIETISKSVRGSSAVNAAHRQGWYGKKLLENHKHHNIYEVYKDVEVTKHDEGTLGDTEEPETGWDWKGLAELPDGYADEMGVDFTKFDWRFGGFAGGGSTWGAAEEIPVGPVIGDLRFTKEGLRFQYENDLSAWGLEYTDANAIACLFVKDNDGNWIGGKFEWISSSRTTRSFENIFDGYNGWDLENVPQTTEAAFVIVSKDGKWRSNVAVATWER